MCYNTLNGGTTMKAIYITETEQGYKLSLEGDYTIFEAQTVLLNAIMNIQDTLLANTPEEHQQALREVIYDKFNEQASALLEHIIPDAELRPDLDEEAILETQNRLIEEKYQACQSN